MIETVSIYCQLYYLFSGALLLNFMFQCLLSSTMIAKTLNSSSQSSLFFIIINHKIPAHVGAVLTIIMIRMMQVIKLASSTEFATKI